MKNITIIIIFYIIFFTSVATSQANYLYRGETITPADLAEKLENRFHYLISQHRAELGLNKLQAHEIVVNASRQHTNYLVSKDLDKLLRSPSFCKQIAHTNYDSRYKQMANEAKSDGYATSGGGEIVTFGVFLEKDSSGNIDIAATAQSILDAFLNSPPHRAIIERSFNTGSLFGAGIILVGNRSIATCNFIGIK